MGYPVKAIANAMLHIAAEHGAPVTPLKLQKLVYIAHGWNLGLTNQPLVDDELPEAWQYGPVFPSLYQEFKDFGKAPITRPASSFEFGNGSGFSLVEPKISEDDYNTWNLLRKIWDVYGKFGGVGLSDLTHREGTPWQQVYNESGGIKNADIPNAVISAHYQDIVKQRAAAAHG